LIGMINQNGLTTKTQLIIGLLIEKFK
jgi:hypothetical protein